MKYDNKQVAKELMVTASGDAYYGNALYVALDIPGLTENEKDILKCYLAGTYPKYGNHISLQDIAIKIANMGE